MTSMASAEDHIGAKISFLFYPGWEEPELMTGWLHGVTHSGPHDQDQMTWLHISDDPVLDDDEDARGLGGYAARSFDILETKPQTKASTK